MTELHILFPVKFTQSNLDQVIFSYYGKSLDSERKQVIIDLSLLEWIGTEEIAFLFAWIRSLLLNGKQVSVWLPYPYDIYRQELYREPSLLKRAKSFLPADTPERTARRINRNLFLLSVWGMLENVGLKTGDFKNIVESYNSKSERIREKFSHLVVPFTAISATKTSSYYHNPYADVINGSKTFRQVGPFDLNEEIKARLIDFNCYSPFENRIISNIITKELFANSLIHANKSGKLNEIEECYFALSLHNEWDNPKSPNFIAQFSDEKDPETLDFYKDKGLILKDFKRRVKLIKADELKNHPKSRQIDLGRYNTEFRNISYLEFTFLDFGDGIYNTLAEKFELKREAITEQGLFRNEKPENQIIEYAFFPESSSDAYNARLQTPELFPRGLYFLLDMVRRYKGLIVVRSGRGKVVYDFSDKVTLRNTGKEVVASISRAYLISDAIRVSKNESAFFDGTMVSIVLPERRKEDVSFVPVRIDNRKLYNDIYFASLSPDYAPRKIFPTLRHEYISMLFIYEKVISEITPAELSTVKGFDSLIYIALLDELKRRSKEGTMLFIDFEFYPRTENISQLLFYLTNSPYINEHSRALVVNLTEPWSKDQSTSNIYNVLKDFRINLYTAENEPHIFRPIPCINFDIHSHTKLDISDINWIGVEHEQDELLLNNLLIGYREDYPIGSFKAKTAYAGNAFAVNQDKIYSLFDTSAELVAQFEEARKEEIFRFTTALIEDGLKPADGKRPYVFHSSVGNYQSRYLSLYETLHNKYLAKFLAKRLLDAFIIHNAGKSVRFDKIITVTVSSQLIGVAIRDLIKDDPNYSILKTGTGISVADCPSLVMLASYYSYETEKPFKKISAGDSILIVNDVISTGNLVKKLIAKTTGKDATIAGVMSIADCRTGKNAEGIAGITFYSLISQLPPELEIVNFPSIQGVLNFGGKSHSRPPSITDLDIKRINPLLNTVVELSNVDAETHRVLFNNPKSFLPEEDRLSQYQNEFFKIGHFVQNLSHNGYLTEMRSMFSDLEGTRIVNEIKLRLQEESNNRLYAESDDDTKLFSMISLARQLKNKNIGGKLIEQITQLSTLPMEAAGQRESQAPKYSPDFIFYPIFSGIENLQPKNFHDIFGTPHENIIGLQRFETDKGWRFPFPPKRFNNVTQNKHVMIFDSGALTGESLIQMIDTISILDVAQIDMVSVIGRVEDFNREFFSRIKALKVKALHKNRKTGATDPLVFRHKVSFANLNIFFGINLHIPVYPSKSNCPFCEEIRELQSYNEAFIGLKFPKPTTEYIESRLSELRIRDFGFEQNIALPGYIPLLKGENGSLSQDVVSIFLMRDKLGRIDSYRFYKEYYLPFDEIIKDLSTNSREVIKDLELIMICILHEPKLYKVHRDLLVGIHNRCREIIHMLIGQERKTVELNFEWSQYAIVRLYFIYTRKTEFNLTTFEQLFTYASGSKDALNYLSFMLWKGFRNLFNDTFIKETTRTILTQMSDNFDSKDEQKAIYQNNEVRNIIKTIVNSFETTEITDINAAFFNLRKFFFSQSSDNSHSEIKRNILHLIGDIQNKDLSPEGINLLLTLSINLMNTLQRDIMANLAALKSDSTLKNCDELQYNTLFMKNSVYQRLKSLIELHTDMISQRKALLQSGDITLFKDFVEELDKFQIEFLLEGCEFVNFCRRYQCDLKKCISTALNTQRVRLEIKKRRNFSIMPMEEENIFVNGHSNLLGHAFEEIFYNAAHCPKNDEAKITMSVSTNPENGVIELIIFQDRPFVDSKRINGIDKIIIPIFTAFCGEENIVFEKTKKNYIITIRFNTIELKNL